MNGEQVRDEARSYGTRLFEEKNAKRAALRKKIVWGSIAIIILIWGRGCFVEVSKASAYKAARTRDRIEASAKKAQDPNASITEVQDIRFGTEPWHVKSNETFELTTESPLVKKDVRANLNAGEYQGRWRSVIREGCVELLCDGRSMGVVCPTMSVPDVERCDEVTHRLANGELAKVEMTVEVRRR